MKNFETTTLPTGSKQQGLPRALGGSALLLAGALLSGCATVANPDPRDPLESYNRSMTNFNEQVDAMVLKPVAIAYQDIAPAPVRTGVSNFFANIGDVWSFVNNVLQLRAEAAASTFMRVNVNTFMGLGGVLDIASELGIDRYKQDFGLTLASPRTARARMAKTATTACCRKSLPVEVISRGLPADGGHSAGDRVALACTPQRPRRMRCFCGHHNATRACRMAAHD